MADVLQMLVYGLVLGSILTLGAIGVSMLFGILRFAHFAHGDMMTFGAYIALSFVTGLGFPVFGALPFAIVVTVALAIAIDRLVYRRLRRTQPVILLISSFGIAMALRALIQMIWGPGNHALQKGIQIPYRVLGVAIKPDHITIVVGAAVLVVALHLFLHRTKLGKAMRAMADNPDLAAITGIDNERVIAWTWGIGASLAATAGVFLALDTHLNPMTGWHVLLMVFAATILGGIGKVYGAILGGLVIGVAVEMSTLMIEPAYKPAVAFAIMVAMLVARPQGLLGGRA
ncbi:MAG: branched-chain amino acid ABC transporter permease [Alphaproteobacteria bacterium]|nr:branched-chain amino acid ABC transporter permease [Alphaproteobacteria bacterium]